LPHGGGEDPARRPVDGHAHPRTPVPADGRGVLRTDRRGGDVRLSCARRPAIAGSRRAGPSGLRPSLAPSPALSVNAPVERGADSGWSSRCFPIRDRWPTAKSPEDWSGVAAYDRSIGDAVLLAALVRELVTTCAETTRPPRYPDRRGVDGRRAPGSRRAGRRRLQRQGDRSARRAGRSEPAGAQDDEEDVERGLDSLFDRRTGAAAPEAASPGEFAPATMNVPTW